MSTETTHVDLIAEVASYNVLEKRFLQLVAAEGLWHLRALGWSTEAEELPVGDELVASTVSARNRGSQRIIRFGDVLVQLGLSNLGELSGRIAASDPDDIADVIAWIAGTLPEAPKTEGVRVRINFWYYGRFGPEEIDRKLDVTTWEDVEAGYAESTRADLEPLMRGFTPGGRGRLLLWHGPPGTGKTSALRALAYEWREWCDVHYITDPETFFGNQPSYMVELLTEKSDDEGDEERWRLLVLEDTGELMRHDAKNQAGQGLSRLLNLVDGMIGQGFPVLVLVTTNEPLGSLHEAVARPGRCLANIDFAPLPAEHAVRWLGERGHELDPPRELTLAECYAVLAGEEIAARHPIGFAS